MSRRWIAGLALAGAALPAVASEGGAIDGKLLISPQFGTMFWTTVTFVLLLLLLRKIAWKPLLGALEAREGQIRGDLDQARKDRDEAQRILEENRAILSQARRERAEAVEAGRRDAERLKDDILEQARKLGEAKVKEATARIESEIRSARAELRRTAADLAIQAAGKLLDERLDDPSQRKLVEDYLADLDRLPPGSASLSN